MTASGMHFIISPCSKTRPVLAAALYIMATRQEHTSSHAIYQ